ncbi:MAG TPA: NADH-quinone oxidoreductase subunit N [Tepidisphaeraceae bacterium]|jgi:NADH-quinone oxidoreductase subunit N
MSLSVIVPELILIITACGLMLLGASSRLAARKAAPVLALLALLVVFGTQVTHLYDEGIAQTDTAGALRVTNLTTYINVLASGIGALLVLLAWPSDPEATGNSALKFGNDAGEFFALLLLSISGIFLVAAANDLILLFLGIELASFPTYIMVSISRPLPVAQEAGVKYFFLGAMAAALMLFGFSYLYGTTGQIDLTRLAAYFAGTTSSIAAPTVLSTWQTLAVVMLIAGFAFKMAAFPLHFYAGDVYEGSATPVTALLSFVPKTSGFVALIKLLFVITGGQWHAPDAIVTLLWFLAAITMTVGNVLGLTQQNVKRTLAYSSVAHSGYMLAGLAVTLGGISPERAQGVLFYLAAYGIVNIAAFGVLMLLPSRTSGLPATSAETFEDLAGTGRTHPGFGLAMAVACFSLIGLPLTVGFFGKLYLILPALNGENATPWNVWLVIIMLINAAISAGYYLRIVGVMFLRGEPQIFSDEPATPIQTPPRAPALLLAVTISAVATLLFGAIFPATQLLQTAVAAPALVDSPPDRSATASSQLPQPEQQQP